MTEKKRAPENTTTKTAGLGFLAESLITGGEGVIERQEAAGQQDLVNSDTLPVQMGVSGDGPNPVAILEAAGMKFLGVVEGDPLFQYVELPPGWKKMPAEHSMWSRLVDDKGRERAAIFYKAAFYDRRAHMRLSLLFSTTRDYKREETEGVAGIPVLDLGNIIHSTEPVKFPRNDRKKYKAWDKATAAANSWLKKNYPDWQNPGAY